MKGLMTLVGLLLGVAAGAQEDGSLRLMFWNLENFFDYRNDSTSISDAEFSSRGERHWTRKRFRTKCQAVAKTLLWAAGECGGVPDAVGLAEVENQFVLKRLRDDTILRKLDYRILHFDSPDTRGIDVALLYRSSRLELLQAKACHVYAGDSTILPTRDILLAHFRQGDGRDLAILVNHHPSKYGGAAVSEPRRKRAVERLRFLSDSLQRLGVEWVVALGDFNDTPDAPLYQVLEPSLQNLSLPLFERGEGTIRFEGEWELIDQIWVSKGLHRARMRILRVPFLLVPDKAYTGEKPFRTYSGPRYIGGVSDHCPVWMDY